MGKMDRQYHATQSQASLIPGEDGNAVCLCVFLFVVSIFYKHSSGGGMKKKGKNAWTPMQQQQVTARKCIEK